MKFPNHNDMKPEIFLPNVNISLEQYQAFLEYEKSVSHIGTNFKSSVLFTEYAGSKTKYTVFSNDEAIDLMKERMRTAIEQEKFSLKQLEDTLNENRRLDKSLNLKRRVI